MKIWKYKYNEETIEVKNSALKVELFVNDCLQDVRKGMFTPASPLIGKLKAGENVKAVVGGDFRIECTLFIDNIQQIPINNQ